MLFKELTKFINNLSLLNKRYFNTGITLLIVSSIIGYGGLAVFISLYLWTDHSFWAWVASIIYAISWGFFGIGFIFSGKEGLKIIKNKLYNTKKP